MWDIVNLIKNHFRLLEVCVLSLVLGIISNYILHKILKKYYTPQHITPISIVISAFNRVLYFVFPLLYFSLFVPLIGLTTTVYIVETIIRIILIIAFSAFVIKFLDYIDIWLERKKKSQGRNINIGALITRAYIIKKILTVAIIFIAISLILLNFPAVREIGKGILISAGVIGGALAFAAQKVFANLFSGLDFVFSKPLSVGDTVNIGSENGNIEKITLSQIYLRTWDSRLIIYPLSYFEEKPFENLSHNEFGLKGIVTLFTDYNTQIEKLRQALTTILQESPLWDGNANSLQVIEVTENNIQLRAVVSAKTPGDLWNLRCEVREKLIIFIQQNPGTILPKSRVQLEHKQSVS